MSTKLMEKTKVQAAERRVATHKVVHEDERMVVTHWVFRPGEQTGWHLHDRDYMPIQMSTGKIFFEMADGSTGQIDYVPGTSTYIKAPVEHNAINVGDVDVVALEIEFKK